jgi:hypothetical protein
MPERRRNQPTRRHIPRWLAHAEELAARALSGIEELERDAARLKALSREARRWHRHVAQVLAEREGQDGEPSPEG